MNIKSFYVYMIHFSKDVLIKDAPDRGRWTNTGMPDNWRYFCMGNALIVGLIEKLGKTLSK